jgi:hypothetical protein
MVTGVTIVNCPARSGVRWASAVLAAGLLAAGCATEPDVTTDPPPVTTTSPVTQPTTVPDVGDTGTESPTTSTAGDTGTESATSTDTGSTTTSTAASSDRLLVQDGLGDVPFGMVEGEALPRVVQVLGRQPDDEMTITGEPGEMPGGFGGTTVRFVDFGPLTVIFNDSDYGFRDDGQMHFAGWTLAAAGPSGWVTPEGITVGSSVDELRAAFGDRLRLPRDRDECSGEWTFSVGPTDIGFEGVLSGPPNDATSRVTTLASGAQSSC